jgi:transcriptional regulator with XRE-family HTH domain
MNEKLKYYKHKLKKLKHERRKVMNLELLKSERKAKGYTQKYMAEQLGFKDRSSYCLIENGKCSVDIELANRIASVLDLSERRTFEIFFASKVQVSST